tara:strand:+ start:331 stop:1263 length:933 start_codon:yes stop_codon:yes gene_type:complete
LEKDKGKNMQKVKNIVKFFVLLPISISRIFENIYEKILRVIFNSQFSSTIRNNYIKNNNLRHQTVTHESKNGDIFNATFFTPNAICQFRADTFSTKEPEMLEWIDDYGDNGVFFDIGANIGLYSVYFAKMKKGMTYAFEPSVFNVGQIAKNISINKLNDKVCLIPNPLSKENSISNFIISDTVEGGALNAFGVNYGYDGKPIQNKIEFGLLGFSLDKMIELSLIKDIPTMIKIDVDGIEHLILEGAKKTLSMHECKTIFIEVNDDFDMASNAINQILKDCGFIFKNKLHNDMLEQSTKFSRIYNQIWVKE